MLQELHVKDFALIEEAYVRFDRGLNVLTGETGAGKTVLVEALELLVGGRADIALVRTGSSAARVEGLFELQAHGLPAELAETLDGGDLVVSRQIAADGKNKCYLNGGLVTAGTLSSVGAVLVDLHGQHEHQSLLRRAEHIDYLDRYGGGGLLRAREAYRKAYFELLELERRRAELAAKEHEVCSRKDLLEYQSAEIERAALRPGEDDELLRERQLLRNQERLREGLSTALCFWASEEGTVHDGGEQVARSLEGLRRVAEIDETLRPLAERLAGVSCELEDAGRELQRYAADLHLEAGRLEEVESRLATLALLKKKYGDTIDDVIAHMRNARAEVEGLEDIGDELQALGGEMEARGAELRKLAAELTKHRKHAASAFSREVQSELAALNMAGAAFKVGFEQADAADGPRLGADGADRVEFLISPNKGEPLKPLTKIASGGEISRVMLALKVILAEADLIPTLVFDEIDAGIGGAAGVAIGRELARLGRRHQVMVVTHLPQIAAFADRHIRVTKEESGGRTITTVDELDADRRESELARMFSGVVSEVSMRHAREVLLEAHAYKESAAEGVVCDR